MIGITLEENLLAVEFKSKVGGELNGAHTKLLANLVNGIALIVKQSHLCRIEIRRLTRPKVGIVYFYRLQFILTCTPFSVEYNILLLLGNHLTIGIIDFHLSGYIIHLVETCNLSLNLYLLVIFSADEKRMAGKIEFLVCNDEIDITI